MRLDLSKVVDYLKAGKLFALPTETVYGLAANAENDEAVSAIFTTKGRPQHHPLIVHIASPEAISHFCEAPPDFAQRLIEAFWPGPLTLILRRKAGLATLASADQPTLALRMPAHPLAQAVLTHAAKDGIWGVAAPSANRFGRVSPTRAQHVEEEFGNAVPVLDGGPCEIGVESTIVDCTDSTPRLLRPGAISLLEIERICGRPCQALSAGAVPEKNIPKASGTLASHYAPRTPLRLLSAQAIATELPQQTQSILVYSRTPITVSPPHMHRFMPANPTIAAHDLFADLREFDKQNVSNIWVEQPPADASWDAVKDRLTRAAFREYTRFT